MVEWKPLIRSRVDLVFHCEWMEVFLECLGVWLWLLFKILFAQKSVPIIFFYFLKIIFEICTSK
jgi:hypothetical protein